MADQIQITIDLPDPKLWANRNSHWRAKGPIAKAYRQAANIAMSLEMVKRCIPVGEWECASLSMEFLFKDKRRRDVFNAAQAMKAAIDGCIDAGLLPDDDWKHLTGGSLYGDVDRENPRVIMSFQRLGKCRL